MSADGLRVGRGVALVLPTAVAGGAGEVDDAALVTRGGVAVGSGSAEQPTRAAAETPRSTAETASSERRVSGEWTDRDTVAWI